MIRSKYTLLLSLVFLGHALLAQNAWFHPDTTTRARINGQTLNSPWAGGLNACQFSSMDLDGDGINDLVVFDRTNNKLSTFLGNTRDKSYLHAPEYETRFPALTNWMQLVDYNNDGTKELFTYTPQGIKVYKQELRDNSWEWKLLTPLIYTRGFSGKINLLVVATDVPALIDIDDDGDLDVVTFEIAGEYAEMHLNVSMEKYGIPDSLEYVRNGNCWGNFIKDQCNDFILDFNCSSSENPLRRSNPNARELHAGNAVLIKDMNGDGIKDMLFGHVTCDNISLLTNTGTNRVGNFTSFSTAFPEKDPIKFNIFPATYAEDIDFDGVSDLIASPNVTSNEGNLMDFESSIWYYRNVGTENIPNYELQKRNFLQDQMVDVGENASPILFDIDGDGDKDLLIGTGGAFGETDFRASIWLFRNKGNAKEPLFEFETKDYLGLSTVFQLTNIVPQWADFDKNGTMDLGFAGVSGRNLLYHYLPNRGRAGSEVRLSPSEAIPLPLPSDTQLGDMPFFYDANQDGNLDLVLGKTLGNISFYINKSTSSGYSFELQTTSFAGTTPSLSTRYAGIYVQDIDLDGKPDLLVTDQRGKTRIYNDGNWGQWAKTDTLLVELNNQAKTPFLGTYLRAIAEDYNGDGKPDLLIGSNAGGLQLFTNKLNVKSPDKEWTVKVFPNPATSYIKIHSEDDASLDVFSMQGQLLSKTPIEIKANQDNVVTTSNWPQGLYILQIKKTDGTTVAVKKLIIN
jgi:hypothetical protein